FRSGDGYAIIAQPAMNPLGEGFASPEVLNLLCGEVSQGPRDLVRDTWRARFGLDDFERKWHRWLTKGYIQESKISDVDPPDPKNTRLDFEPSNVAKKEILILPDPNIGDGIYANNPWLQEIPRP